MFDLHATDRGLEMSGALDGRAATVLLRLVDATDENVWLDASGVERIDAAGLTALAVARHHCRTQGRSFVVDALPPAACRELRVGAAACELFAAPLGATRPAPASTVRTLEPPSSEAPRRATRRWIRRRSKPARPDAP